MQFRTGATGTGNHQRLVGFVRSCASACGGAALPTVLALGPRRALALEGNDETRRRMERAGVDVVTYRGDEISRKGDGGPTCLTRPVLRG